MSKTSTPFVSIVIPLYNNAATAKLVLETLDTKLKKLSVSYEILLSDDASSDKTSVILKSFSKHRYIYTLFHTQNEGIARSLKQLYGAARGEYTLLFSVDGGWQTDDVIRLIQAAQKTHKDIIIGKRVNKEYPISRKVISWVYNLIPRIFFGIKTYDIGSIKIFRTRIFHEIKTNSQSVFFEPELFIKAVTNGYSMSYIPVSHLMTKRKKKSWVTIPYLIHATGDAIRFILVR